MATNFPTSKDDSTSLPYPSATNNTNSPSLAAGQDNQNDAIIAIENKLGTGASTPSNGNLLVGTGAGTSAWTKAAPSGSIVGTSDSQTLTNKTLTSPTINSPNITNATITADTVSGYTTSNSGSIYGVSVSTGGVSAPSTLAVTGATTLSSTLAVTGTSTLTGQLSVQTGTAPPAAGATTSGIKVSSTANFGIFWGSGAPTFSAAQGSLYLRTDGSSTSTRLYVNTNGSTTWTNFTSAA